MSISSLPVPCAWQENPADRPATRPPVFTPSGRAPEFPSRVAMRRPATVQRVPASPVVTGRPGRPQKDAMEGRLRAEGTSDG